MFVLCQLLIFSMKKLTDNHIVTQMTNKVNLYSRLLIV